MNIKDIKDKAKSVKDKIAKTYANKYITKERTLRDFVETVKIEAEILCLTFFAKNGHNIDRPVKDCLVAKALYTKTGRRMLAEAMVEPIRKSLDYAGIGRKLLMVDELPQSQYKTSPLKVRYCPLIQVLENGVATKRFITKLSFSYTAGDMPIGEMEEYVENKDRFAGPPMITKKTKFLLKEQNNKSLQIDIIPIEGDTLSDKIKCVMNRRNK